MSSNLLDRAITRITLEVLLTAVADAAEPTSRRRPRRHRHPTASIKPRAVHNTFGDGFAN